MMLKTWKKMAAIMMAMSILLGLNLTGVFAETDASGRDLSKPVSLTIVKYAADDTLFEGIGNTGVEQKDISNQAKPLAGVIFEIIQVKLKEGSPVGSTEPEDYVKVGTFTGTGTTDATGMVKFSSAAGTSEAQKLPGQGIYKVSEVNSATIGTTAISDFIVSLPMADPGKENENAWLYDVFAYPKNDIVKSIDKELEESNTKNNIVSWTFSVIIPDDLAINPTDKEKLVITDVLDYRLSYIEDSIVGVYTDKVGTLEHELDDETDYELTKSINATNPDKPIETLKISITKDGFEKLAQVHGTSGTNIPTLYFTFQTKTNIGSDPDDLDVIYNGGELEYTNSLDQEYPKETIDDSDKPEAELYGIEINKINVNNEALANAKFILFEKEDDAKTGQAEKALKKADDSVWEITTDNQGLAYFNGLSEGKYYLVETAAPTGYNKLTAPIEVVIKADDMVDENRLVQITVTNRNGFTLPTTGGMGTIVFTAAGLIFIGIAVLLLILAQKRNKKKS